MLYKEEYKKWCEDLFFDEKTRKELLEIKDNEEEIEDRFYKELEFGTAGLRGVMGAGTNRMNRYTVGKATQGLANYITKEGSQEKGVVIAYDSRNNSKEFSEITSLVLNANGIKTYVFDSLRPVPELSYAVRNLKAVAGVMITASHNPPKYNGYKVYGEDGAQITFPVDKKIMDEVKSITNYNEIKNMSKEEAIEKGLYNTIGKEIDKDYMEELKKYILNWQSIKDNEDLSIVYTPLHGTGNVPVQTILKEIGFKNIHIVKEQEMPDGNFPTVEYPNPEYKEVFKLALELAKEKNAEIILATDPDADRLGIYGKDTKTGEYKAFTGNMSALLIAEYILSQKREQGTLPTNGAMIKSIVSSTLADEICEEYGVKLFNVLTGFKYIGEKMKEFEISKEYEYVFSFEESYGCLIGEYIRDKDAVSAIMALCEAAAYYKNKGLTLWDQMINIYEKYGYYEEKTISITKEGIEGIKNIEKTIHNLRENPPKNIGEFEVIERIDYKKGEIVNIENQTIEKTNLPIANVLYYKLSNNAWCCVRPSGNEPQIKYYIGVKGKNFEDSNRQITELEKNILSFD